MADENTARSYRSPDTVRRAGAPSSGGQVQGGDPLAELARLIGQSDPFAEFGPKNARSPEPQAPAGGVPDWRKTAAGMPAYEEAPEPSDEARYGSAPSPLPRTHQRDSRGYAHDQSYGEENPPDQEQRSDSYSEPRASYAAHDARDGIEADEQPFAAPERVDNASPAGHRQEPENEPFYSEGAPISPEDQDFYDDAPRSRRRNGAITAVTLIACAILGTAGAYGFRTYYSGPTPPKVPPVIVAEVAPSKIVPATEGQAGKVIQDRVREPGSSERVVSREEQPVEVQTQTAPPPPRVVLPSPVAPAMPQAQGSGSQAATPAGEPKRVRTVTIRPDGTDMSGSRWWSRRCVGDAADRTECTQWLGAEIGSAAGRAQQWRSAFA